jgi:thiamine kinase-like enzyme
LPASTTCATTHPHRRPAPPVPPGDAEACQRPRLHLLGLPRHPRLCAHARGRQQPHAPELAGYLALAEELEAAQVPLPVVFGHNDLLPANILDDGRRLWLIDFEYAGFNTAMFDLAGIRLQCRNVAGRGAGPAGVYFGHTPGPDIQKSFAAAMQCASLLREAMWSMVSEIILDAPGADYEAYTQENLERLRRTLDHYRTEYGKTA